MFLCGQFLFGGGWLRYASAGDIPSARFSLVFAILRVPPPRYEAKTIRKWLMMRALRKYVVFCIFSLTFLAYMLNLCA